MLSRCSRQAAQAETVTQPEYLAQLEQSISHRDALIDQSDGGYVLCKAL